MIAYNELLRVFKEFNAPHTQYETSERLQMFIEYLTERKSLLDTLLQATIKVSGKGAQITHKEIDEKTKTAAQTTILYYFRLRNRAAVLN